MSAPVYRALALQSRCDSVSGLDAAAARARIREAIARLGEELSAARRFIGPELRLVVLPEYLLTGYPAAEECAAWHEVAALEPEGPELAALAALAGRLGLYLCVNAYERDPAFPGFYFQVCRIFSDQGATILRYRRLLSLFAPTPWDVLSRFLAVYGEEALLPVADTPLGRLACIASEEILFPEIARALALRGAEVLLHPTSEAGSPALTPKEVARRARAVENLAFVVSANTAGVHGGGLPAASADGMSKIVDFEGRVLAEAGFGPSLVANAELDLGALRRARRRPGMGNLLARQRQALFAASQRLRIEEPDGFLRDGEPLPPSRAALLARHREAVARLVALGIVPEG
ncbi:MAG: nitrilase-related carbon-nitrogen hydrolase [Xanthomonadales bacterium]|nr:nitrilase-related carbon-nitrogen hydrolase [Xanthomonadales bacterium]